MAQLSKLGVQNLSRLFGHFSLLLLIFSNVVNAGSFENFKRTQTESFKSYKNERDNKFATYLKSEWSIYLEQNQVKLYGEKKPQSIPLASPKKIKSVGPVVNIKIEELPKSKKENKKVAKKDISFDFYGEKLSFNVPVGLKKAIFYPQNQKGVSAFFDTTVTSEYEYLVENINSVCKNLNLNDWGIYLLVDKISNHIFSNQDESNLLNWFLFNKLGYTVKVGIVQKHIVVLYYSKKVIYDTPNYTFGKNKFYALSKYAKGNLGKVYSYKYNYSDEDKEFDLSLKSMPHFMSDIKKKTLSFKDSGKMYTVSFEYNQNIIDFLATYPQADYETYFNAPLESNTYNDISIQLKKYIDGRKSSDAINFVLHFVQKAFKYERDTEQFGKEKVMFAEETLYYDKSDCEDRSVLFANLIKKLFGISVVGVKYKDHMSTALYIPMSGDSVNKGSRKFVIADPTYVNANIGQAIPKYKSIKPERIYSLFK